ncbi:MAG TPA: PadR family transcriptional regulator [Nocardioides sp.]|jgi:DNA-binding PadR family transcriptional regulator|uniref:PadR family transcriptional regulator n=1 Tax=Nocardioides sp. TaxID=35761 RepID=UPI002C460123|nr:PadR family transcriptional regulator [Nocardioides sp.]HTW16104.1 PadR family transcriptional regulator [Nocardioides sp.]
MGQRGFNRQWSRYAEDQFQQHRGRGGRGGPFDGPWQGGGFGGGFGGRQGPPPWVAGLFGLDQGERRRGPRVRRGDVRSAILDVLRSAQEGEPINGYQVIQQITERSGGAWRPSPGSVYPTIQQLQDEGLVEVDESSKRRTVRLTEDGEAYVAERGDELAAVWTPFEDREREERSDFADLKPEIGQVMGAVWQIVTTGSESQRRAAVDVLVDTRRRLYGILAEGDTEGTEEADEA